MRNIISSIGSKIQNNPFFAMLQQKPAMDRQYQQSQQQSNNIARYMMPSNIMQAISQWAVNDLSQRNASPSAFAHNLVRDVPNTASDYLSGLLSLPGMVRAVKNKDISLGDVGKSLIKGYEPLVRDPIGTFYNRPVDTTLSLLPFLQGGKLLKGAKTARLAKASPSAKVMNTASDVVRTEGNMTPFLSKSPQLNAFNSWLSSNSRKFMENLKTDLSLARKDPRAFKKKTFDFLEDQDMIGVGGMSGVFATSKLVKPLAGKTINAMSGAKNYTPISPKTGRSLGDIMYRTTPDPLHGKTSPKIPTSHVDRARAFESFMSEADDAFKFAKTNKPQSLSEKLLGLTKDKWQGIRASIDPMTKAPPEAQSAFQQWRNINLRGQLSSDELAKKYINIPEKEGVNFMHYLESPTKTNLKKVRMNPERVKEIAQMIRTEYDTIWTEASRRGVDVGYLKNYVNHVWKESADEITKIVRSSGVRPSFAKSREIPTYAEGLKVGLTPRFSHPSQLVAHYRHSLEKASANDFLIKKLKEAGFVREARVDPSWKPLDLPYTHNLDGMFAKKEVATLLHNLFREAPQTPMNTFYKNFAKTSRLMQEITLSGGYKQINAFTYAQMQKEFLAGRLKSPLSAFFRSFNKDKSHAFFDQNKKYIYEMAENGYQLRTATSYQQRYANAFEKSGLTKAIKKFDDTWDSFFNEPTFQRFMPQLELQLYKDMRLKGMNGSDATKVIRNFYGSFDDFARAPTTKNKISSAFFAPRFRQALLGFWKNTAQSILPKNIKDPTYALNRRFLAGSTILYGVYNLLNYQLNGRFMWENKGSKKWSLEIPYKDDPSRSVYIPFLPSIATVPRISLEAGGAFATGDPQTGVQRLSRMTSQPLQLGAQLLSNRTFYEAPIYKDEDKPFDRFKKLATYATGQTLHPYARELVEYKQGRKRPMESLLGAFEASVYPGSSTEYHDFRGHQGGKYTQLTQQGYTKESSKNYILHDRHKKEVLRYYVKGDTKKAQQLLEKYQVQLYEADLYKALAEEVTYHYARGNIKKAQKILDVSGGLPLEYLQAPMKKEILRLYWKGDVEEAQTLMETFNVQITTKDLQIN